MLQRTLTKRPLTSQVRCMGHSNESNRPRSYFPPSFRLYTCRSDGRRGGHGNDDRIGLCLVLRRIRGAESFTRKVPGLAHSSAESRSAPVLHMEPDQCVSENFQRTLRSRLQIG